MIIHYYALYILTIDAGGVVAMWHKRDKGKKGIYIIICVPEFVCVCVCV